MDLRRKSGKCTVLWQCSVFTFEIKQEKCKMYNICHFNFGNAILIGHSAGGCTLMSISKSGGLDWLYEKRNAQSVKIIFSGMIISPF